MRRTPLRPRAKKKRGPRIDYGLLPLAKQPKPVPVLWEFPDGRIIYNRRHPQGAHLYDCAVTKMWLRQRERCSIGGEKIARELGTFDHGEPRRAGGKGWRNDDPDAVGPDGTYLNSCACLQHNKAKGSRRDYPMAIRIKAPRAEGRTEQPSLSGRSKAAHQDSSMTRSRSNAEKRAKDLYDAQNYLDMIQAKLNELKSRA